MKEPLYGFVMVEGHHDNTRAGDTGGLENARAASVAEHDIVAEPPRRTKPHKVGFDRDKRQLGGFQHYGHKAADPSAPAQQNVIAEAAALVAGRRVLRGR